MENKTVETIYRDGYKINFVGEPDLWRFGEVWAKIGGERYGAEVTVTGVTRKSDGSHVPRKS